MFFTFSHTSIQKEARDWVLGIIETGHLEKPCRMNTENIAPCFCIQSSTHRALRMSVYKTSRSCILTTPRSDWFLHRPAVKFSRFRFRGTEPKTLLYVGHRSLGELWRCEDTQFFGNQSLHGANFLFQTTDYPDIFLSTVHIKKSWLSVQFVGNNKAHKWHQSSRIKNSEITCHRVEYLFLVNWLNWT